MSSKVPVSVTDSVAVIPNQDGPLCATSDVCGRSANPSLPPRRLGKCPQFWYRTLLVPPQVYAAALVVIQETSYNQQYFVCIQEGFSTKMEGASKHHGFPHELPRCMISPQAPPSPVMEVDGSHVLSEAVRVPTGSTITAPDALLEEDGRTYHGYDQGSYYLPNDGEEQDRLDLQHAAMTLLLGGNFGLAPFGTPPKRVLDIATGTGIWALEFARQHPASQVFGTDLSMIQPAPDVPNCQFIRENSETADWIFPNTFDYVHMRFTMSCFNDTAAVLQKVFDQLDPGGWVELLDSLPKLCSEDGTGQGSALERWGELLVSGSKKLGRDMAKAVRYKALLAQTGFVEVTERIIPAAVSGWPKDRSQKQIGIFIKHDTYGIIKSCRKIMLATGMSPDELDQLNDQVREELVSEQVHGTWPVYTVYARKPLEAEMTPAQLQRWNEKKQEIAQEASKQPL